MSCCLFFGLHHISVVWSTWIQGCFRLKTVMCMRLQTYTHKTKASALACTVYLKSIHSLQSSKTIHEHHIFIIHLARQSKHTGAILLIISNGHDYQWLLNIYVTISNLLHLLHSFPTYQKKTIKQTTYLGGGFNPLENISQIGSFPPRIGVKIFPLSPFPIRSCFQKPPRSAIWHLESLGPGYYMTHYSWWFHPPKQGKKLQSKEGATFGFQVYTTY